VKATAVLRRLVMDQSARTPAVPGLTRAELRLLPLLATHLSLPKIGAELSLSPNTVKRSPVPQNSAPWMTRSDCYDKQLLRIR